jgi:hypothetical protein
MFGTNVFLTMNKQVKINKIEKKREKRSVPLSPMFTKAMS